MIVYRNMTAMGTQLDIILPGISDNEGDNIFIQIKNEITRLENVFNNYNENSLFSKANREAYSNDFGLNEEIFSVFSNLNKYSILTKGTFDYSLANFYANKEKFSSDILKDYLKIDIQERILLDDQKKTIRFTNPLVKIDSGSFGKGLALDYIKNILKGNKINDAFISFGGSSVMGMGKHTAADFWPVGIQDPEDLKKTIYVFNLKNNSISTSGNSSNNRKRYKTGHIFDPFAGKLNEDLQLVSVQGESAFINEILSTALFCSDDDTAEKIMTNFKSYKAIRFKTLNNIIHKTEYHLNED